MTNKKPFKVRPLSILGYNRRIDELEAQIEAVRKLVAKLRHDAPEQQWDGWKNTLNTCDSIDKALGEGE